MTRTVKCQYCREVRTYTPDPALMSYEQLPQRGCQGKHAPARRLHLWKTYKAPAKKT